MDAPTGIMQTTRTLPNHSRGKIRAHGHKCEARNWECIALCKASAPSFQREFTNNFVLLRSERDGLQKCYGAARSQALHSRLLSSGSRVVQRLPAAQRHEAPDPEEPGRPSQPRPWRPTTAAAGPSGAPARPRDAGPSPSPRPRGVALRVFEPRFRHLSSAQSRHGATRIEASGKVTGSGRPSVLCRAAWGEAGQPRMGRWGRFPLAAALREPGWVEPRPGPRECRAGRRACVAALASAPRWERCGTRTAPVSVSEERAGGRRMGVGPPTARAAAGGGEAARCSVMVRWGPAGVAGMGAAFGALRDEFRAPPPERVFQRAGRVTRGVASYGARPAFFEAPRGGRGSAPFS